MMDLIFFDTNPEIMVVYEKILGPYHAYSCTDVNNIVDHSNQLDYIMDIRGTDNVYLAFKGLLKEHTNAIHPGFVLVYVVSACYIE